MSIPGVSSTAMVQMSCFDTMLIAPTPEDMRSSHLQSALSVFTYFLSEISTWILYQCQLLPLNVVVRRSNCNRDVSEMSARVNSWFFLVCNIVCNEKNGELAKHNWALCFVLFWSLASMVYPCNKSQRRHLVLPIGWVSCTNSCSLVKKSAIGFGSFKLDQLFIGSCFAWLIMGRINWSCWISKILFW